MNLLRAKLNASYNDYFDELYRLHGCIPENHQTAINLRMQFFTKYILEKTPSDHKTGTEKDWAYVARREYRYDVNVRALADAFALADLACIIRMFMLKKFVIWPFIPVFIGTYLYRSRSLFIFNNKKFFDMCNVGEQYELGYARNVVLRRVNGLTDR
jgi:hypothetical protein